MFLNKIEIINNNSFLKMESYFSKFWEIEDFLKNYGYGIAAKTMLNDGKLPQILINIQRYLENQNIILTNHNSDGRTNSCGDENVIIYEIKKFLSESKYWIPPSRHWFDIALCDEVYGWIPVNIKSTTFDSSADNSGNLTLCVQAYTDYQLDLKKSYKSGFLVKKLEEKIKENEFNNDKKKRLFFSSNK